ncbi:unnamed protein product [Kluyveromyces dobzhanskii CBS 2104]|uniref:WGS project CCBQ000000000 data, contig 00010 n=1 Tax=Kluyveromyces dobzhanskii CBS 2104 TaxID=1427455 RepID=A0A0A8LAG7_9SACH|nr:unnamed protein product [Kluyveromyces dobzhanskii CBS 2104]
MSEYFGTLQKRPLEQEANGADAGADESQFGKKPRGEPKGSPKGSPKDLPNGSLPDKPHVSPAKDILEETKADELDEVVDDYEEKAVVSDAAGISASVASASVADEGVSTGAGPVLSVPASSDRQYAPLKPEHPINLEKDPVSRKYIFPAISKEDSLNARSYLKQFGSARFLDDYLPEDLNSLYVYHMIKLLGFQIKDKELTLAIQAVVHSPDKTTAGVGKAPAKENNANGKSVAADSYPSPSFEDPLEKKHAVRLIKDLQKAMNKVLSTRIRLTNFHTVDDFVAKLKTAKKIIVLTGAGISTSLGIPDFRSSEGFYSKLGDLGLNDPQDVFSLEVFTEDPSVFYNIAHMVLPPENLYSPLHSFIKMIQDKDKLLRNYTQNIDNLESYAGVEPEKMVQCHGSFATASCVTCHWKIQGERIFPNIRNLQLPICPYCYSKRLEFFKTKTDGEPEEDVNEGLDHNVRTVSKSFGVLKPDITFFGEALPSKFHRLIKEDVLQCDLLICIGTSLKVAPVSEIVNMIPAHVPQVLINKDPVKHAEFDLSLLGLCDDVAALVAQKCGWKIPHDSWNKLENKEFGAEETERGVYKVFPVNVATAEREAEEEKHLPLQQSTAALTPPVSLSADSPAASPSLSPQPPA